MSVPKSVLMGKRDTGKSPPGGEVKGVRTGLFLISQGFNSKKGGGTP